jgi:hypothetical protein
LYGVDRGSDLFVIDYVNGASTSIGPLGFAQASAFTINQTTGDAFASPGGGGGFPQTISGCLYGVDLSTGDATQIGCDPLQEGLDPFSDFAFHSNGTMYALRLASNAAPQDQNMHLCAINLTTGGIADIGITHNWSGTCNGNSLAFVSDVLYTWDTCSGLSTVDIADASQTPIGFGNYIGFPASVVLDYPRIPAMAARRDGTLYGTLVDAVTFDSYLVTMASTTGDVTYVATLPEGMQNLAFSGIVADGCPSDPAKTEAGLCGCGVPDSATDTDGDGTIDCLDQCPSDPGKTEPGICGCGTADTDTDSDGTPDCNDGCPADPGKTAPGVCGCGTADTDTDSDGTPDCNDGCPADPGKTAPGVCGCGTADTDSDSDTVLDCNDNCPLLSNPDQTDANGNSIGDACETLPDLTASWTSLKFNSNNSTLSGRTKILNTGNLNAGTFTVSYYLSTNGTDLGTLIGTSTISGVRAGRSVNSSLKYQSQTSPSGQYVIAVVDSGGQVTEENEGNNRASLLIP